MRDRPKTRSRRCSALIATIAVVLVTAAGLASPTGRRGDSALRARPIRGVAPSTLPAPAETLAALPAVSRRHALEPESPPSLEEPATEVTALVPRAPTRVHGTVLRGGLFLEDLDLEVRSASEPTDDGHGDWDFTDEHGRYEVLVPPGRYRVTSEAFALPMDLIVPRGVSELRVDIDL